MLFRNTLAQTASLLTSNVFSFILAPLMLWRLGLAQFGVWAVTGAFATYAALMDLGITKALGRFVAFYHARNDRRAIEQCFTLGLLAITFIGIVAGLGAILAAGIVSRSLDDVLDVGEMRIVLLCSVAIAVLNAYRSILRSVPQGMEQFVAPNIAVISFNAVNFTLSVAALAASRELVPYAVANVAAGVIGIGLGYLALRHVAGALRLRMPPRALVREVLGFSLQNQLAWIGELSTAQAAKVIIALFLDVRLAGAYEVANRAVLASKSVAIVSISAMVPTATVRIVTHGLQVISDFYRRYTVYAMAVSFPMLACLAASAPALLVAWLGRVPDYSVGIFVALTLASCVSLSGGVANVLALSEGRVGMIAVSSAVSTVVTMATMLALAPALEIWGVVAGSVLGTVTYVAIFLVYFHRRHHIGAAVYVRSAGVPAMLAAVPAAPVALCWLFLDAPDDRRAALPLSAVLVAAYVAAYWPLADRFGILPERLRLHAIRGRLRLWNRVRGAEAGSPAEEPASVTGNLGTEGTSPGREEAPDGSHQLDTESPAAVATIDRNPGNRDTGG